MRENEYVAVSSDHIFRKKQKMMTVKEYFNESVQFGYILMQQNMNFDI